MKKAFCIPLLCAFLACGDSNGVDDDNQIDSVTSTPSAIDTAQHPNGITSGSVISTDTAAMRADTNINK